MKRIGSALLGIANIGVKGFVIAKMWLWYVVPLGLIEISIVHAVCLSTILKLLIENDEFENNEIDLKESYLQQGGQFVELWLTLLFAFILKHFI